MRNDVAYVGACCVGWFSTIVGFEEAKKTCEQICRLVMLGL